jgi:hypothetical protein
MERTLFTIFWNVLRPSKRKKENWTKEKAITSALLLGSITLVWVGFLVSV